MAIQQVSTISLPENATTDTGKQPLTNAEIQAWLISYLSELLEIDQSEIDVNVPFERYGLDSSAAIGLTGDLENLLGYELEPTILYDYPTIEVLSEQLVAA
ncbi:acyl carrier protein [Komarekiella sp. 'clone 1']|uniref:Acyl carrier protein n=1 Tax=Komarekiella delphini-convector SJRDD-AB1 TaxID=2593771 RepID=A0AA40SZW9_9NOST|nr:acyl carrier protein [Komarekiella delphini-convector]MBD6618040.1 acyl carrier protein [Komarekiella delphini-convector SJRDD-AB1]